MKALAAHIEDGPVVLDQPLPAEASGYLVVLLPEVEDLERERWLKISEGRLLQVWDNDQDDVYNELLNS